MFGLKSVPWNFGLVNNKRPQNRLCTSDLNYSFLSNINRGPEIEQEHQKAVDLGGTQARAIKAEKCKIRPVASIRQQRIPTMRPEESEQCSKYINKKRDWRNTETGQRTSKRSDKTMPALQIKIFL